MLVTVNEYARIHGLAAATVRQKAAKGGYKTAQKGANNQWYIDSTEVMPDRRTKGGQEQAQLQNKKYRTRELYDREKWDLLTERERRQILCWEQAKEYSGLKQYPTACQEAFNRLPEDAADHYTVKELGEIARLIYQAYEDGKQYGREHPDEESSIF